jgi:hypothetical protein
MCQPSQNADDVMRTKYLHPAAIGFVRPMTGSACSKRSLHAVCLDSEGNSILLHQLKRTAK